MEMKWWIVLSSAWKLENVQAGLVVVVSVLAFVAVFASARYFWHLSARRIAKNADVPISSLLSFTTLGEAFDVIVLLRSKLFHSKHFTLAIQCLLVVAFSACAIFAGPISRYATKVGERDSLRPNSGLLATQSYSCELNNNIRWHNISTSLDQANYPHDRLLDFLPDTKSNWVYHADDWNSTYSAKCSITTEANLTLEAIGNYTLNDFYIYDDVPGLSDVFSRRFLDDKSAVYDWWYSGVKLPREGKWESMIFYSYAELRPDNDGGSEKWDDKPTQQMSIHISTIGMHDVPAYEMTSSDDFDYAIGEGKIGKAWYTKVECDLTRNLPADKPEYWSAYIETGSGCPMTQNMDQFFSASIAHPHIDNTTLLVLPNGTDLFRFYQSYTISKDTHFPHPVIRPINLRLPTIELSTVFLAIMSLVTLFVIIGLIHSLVCRFTYSDLYNRVPETKVDWLLQSLREAETNVLVGHGRAHEVAGFHAPSTVSDEEYLTSKPSGIKEKIPWEKARYSLAHPHYSPATSSDGYSTPAHSTTGLGRISVNRAPSPAPPSLVPGSTPPPQMQQQQQQQQQAVPFTQFINNNNGNHPGSYTSYPTANNGILSPTIASATGSIEGERVVSYGLASARYQPVVTVGPRSEKGECEVGIVESANGPRR